MTFKDAGFKFPKDDEDMLKVPPVMLGAEALKQNFPKSVWPGSLRRPEPCRRRSPEPILQAACSASLQRATLAAASRSGSTTTLVSDSLSVRAGQFELDLPVTQARSYNWSPYNIYQHANIGAMNSMVSLQQNVSNTFTFANPPRGLN